MVRLIYSSPLWLISNGIRMSHNNHYLSDTEELICECIAEELKKGGDSCECKKK